MKSITSAVIFAFIGGAVTAVIATAAEKTIMQKGKQFSEMEISVKKGDTVIFVNDDTVAHNVYSTSAGNEFNLGAQAPGVSTPVTFNAAGSFKVLCAIHPRMQLAVSVQ